MEGCHVIYRKIVKYHISILFTIAGFVYLLTTASAQSQVQIGLSIEVFGSSDGSKAQEDPSKRLGPLYGLPRHLDPSGQPCLNVSAGSERQAINRMIYDQLLLLDNHCYQEIKIRACYDGRSDCQDILAPSNKRVRHVFGVFVTPTFHFTFREYVR